MWNHIEPNLNDEETLSDTFSTTGLFKISGDANITEYPKVQASIQNKRIFIAVDKSVIMLENENLVECNFFSFGAQIDAMSISQSGNIIICALADGHIHGLYIKGFPVFDICVREDDIGTIKSFVEIYQIEESFYIMCSNGRVYRLSHVDEKFLESYKNETLCEDETRLFNETILKNTTLQRLTDKTLFNEISSFSINTMKKHEIIENFNQEYSLVIGTNQFIQFQTNITDNKVSLPESYQGIKHIYNLKNLILGLSNKGELFEICPNTSMIFNPFGGNNLDIFIDDLIVMENDNDDIELLILTKSNQLNERFIKILEFPSMKCNYELVMPQDVWLVQQPKASVNIYYVCGENYNENNIPQAIEMKIVCEIYPEQRMKKLIQKGHLNEAEEFGKQFNLCLQPIYEAKARRTLIEINSTKDDNKINKLFTSLLDVLNLIENKDFFLGISKIEIPNRNKMEKFLNILLNHLPNDQYESVNLDIKEQQLRLETLKIIDPSECLLEWQKFVHHPNIVKICIGYFKTDMPTACVIWKRHTACILPYLDVKNIEKLLNAIPSTIEPFNVIQWLKTFVPSILQTHPSIMSSLVEWSIQKIRSLQYSNHWPEIGLEFSTNVTTIFEDVHFLYSDIRRQYDTNIEKLKLLVNALEELSVLKSSYNLKFTLDNYIKDSIDKTSLCILQRVQLSNLKKIINDFLYPIYLEKGNNPINAIKEYLQFLITNRKSISFWLERAVVLIELLHNEDDKLIGTLLVLKSAPVPWPEILIQLIKLSNSSHPLAHEIQTEYELQIIKIMKVKYGWPTDSRDNNMKLVFRIIKMNLPDMIQDIKDLIKASPEICSNANFYCCYELSRRGDLEIAINYFDSLEEKQKNECYEKVINIFSSMLDETTSDNLNSDNLIEFLKLITTRSNLKNLDLLRNLENREILKRNFNINVQCNKLHCKLYKSELLKIGIDYIIENIKQQKTNITHYIWIKIDELTKALETQKLIGIIEIIKKLQNLHLSCALGYYVLDLIEINEFIIEYFIDLATLLIVQEMELNQGNDVLQDPLTYPLAFKLLIESLKCGKLYQLEVLELLKWIRIVNDAYDLTAVKDYYKNYTIVEENVYQHLNTEGDKTSDIIDKKTNKRQSISVFEEVISNREHPQNDPNPILRCVSFALRIIMLELNPKDSAFKRISSFMQKDLEETEIKKGFFESLEHLISSKQHNTWYVIVQYIIKYQRNSDIIILHESFISRYQRKMFRYILSQKEPNFIDLFTMVLSDTNPVSCLEYLSSDLRTGQQKINYLLLSEMYNTHIGDKEKVAEERESRMKYFYYTELCKKDSTLKSKTNLEFISISQLMKELKNKILDVNLLYKLSCDFDWNYQEVLVSQVITVLNLQEINYEIKIDAFGKEEIIVKTTVEQIRELCQPYINEITCIDLLKSKLLHFIGEINFYFYELYLYVIDILCYINRLPKEMELWTSILVYLKHKMITKRHHRPGQLETDSWLKSQQEIGVLPKISKYRFPFKLIVEQPLKYILDDEVSVDNCESFFPLIKLHTTLLQSTPSQKDIMQMKEYFCMSAVNNAISEYKQQHEDTDSDVWHLQPINNSFLQSVLRLVNHMSDLSKILAILYYVTNHAPDGCDQVEAAHECYKFALKHEQELLSIPKAQETVTKIKRKYPIFKTQHLLHIYGLVEEKFLQLVENPKELINALYHHDAILKSPTPEINKITKEISDLHNFDFHIIQISLLQKWLSFASNTDSFDMDETFYEDLNASIIPMEAINDEYVIRAHYILSSWESDKALQFLVCHIFPVEGVINPGKQLQMIECFTKLMNESNLSYIEIVKQQQYIILKCVHYLKQLGYNFTVEKFTDYDKLTLLKKIWQNHATNSNALEIMTYICLGFDINIPKVWNGILKQMVNLNMIKELNALVDLLSCKNTLLHIDGLALAWEAVLRAPFKSANRTRSVQQENVLSKNLFRIQTCPLVTRLNLIEFAEDCIRLDRPHMAAILIAFSNNPQKDIIKKMVREHKKCDLKKEITNLEEMGIFPIIIRSVLKELN